MKYQVNFIENPSEKDVSVLGKGIMAFATEQRGFEPIEFFGFFIRDEHQEIVGGCNCDNLYGCLYIDSLWITESLRGLGYGTELMNAVENLAKTKGLSFMAVNTMDWEALDFYKKFGFYVEFERHGFNKNSIFYFLRKNL